MRFVPLIPWEPTPDLFSFWLSRVIPPLELPMPPLELEVATGALVVPSLVGARVGDSDVLALELPLLPIPPLELPSPMAMPVPIPIPCRTWASTEDAARRKETSASRKIIFIVVWILYDGLVDLLMTGMKL